MKRNKKNKTAWFTITKAKLKITKVQFEKAGEFL